MTPLLTLPTAQVVVATARHNAFTDLAYWNGAFWLVYVEAPTHFASPASRLVVLRSPDGRAWRESARFNGTGQDIRDPKLAVSDEGLMVWALLNRSFDPQPYTTVMARSPDGVRWTGLDAVQPAGWLLGRPQRLGPTGWLATAHAQTFDRVVLLESPDGEHWTIRSVIAAQPGLDETACTIQPDGQLLVVIRYEANSRLWGSAHAGTLITTAPPPYTHWSEPVWSAETRLDGPSLILYQNHVLAVGRRQPDVRPPWHQSGSIFSRKRTALFSVTPHALHHIADLPSSGDTAYAGLVQRAGQLTISYYSRPPTQDEPWVVGMLRPTQIYLAQIDLATLEVPCLPDG